MIVHSRLIIAGRSSASFSLLPRRLRLSCLPLPRASPIAPANRSIGQPAAHVCAARGLPCRGSGPHLPLGARGALLGALPLPLLHHELGEEGHYGRDEARADDLVRGHEVLVAQLALLVVEVERADLVERQRPPLLIFDDAGLQKADQAAGRDGNKRSQFFCTPFVSAWSKPGHVVSRPFADSRLVEQFDQRRVEGIEEGQRVAHEGLGRHGQLTAQRLLLLGLGQLDVLPEDQVLHLALLLQEHQVCQTGHAQFLRKDISGIVRQRAIGQFQFIVSRSSMTSCKIFSSRVSLR